jgi:hypothetical protein
MNESACGTRRIPDEPILTFTTENGRHSSSASFGEFDVHPEAE